jgi:tRNA-2-methylthio-N6-dimethylallyladenosine synthase
MKLHTISFGCQMSTADSEEMARPLLARGYTPTAELSEADAVVVSTCTVRQHAEDKAVSLLGRLRDWKEERPERFIIVAGCAAERIGEWIQKRFKHVDLVVGATRIEAYPLLLEQAMKKRFDWARDNQGAWSGLSQDNPLAPTHAPGLAYVTIMRGCNYSCSYCIVPAVRGRELYRPFDKVVEEVRNRVEQGAKDVTLLGQTVNSYREGGRDFADLLRAVDKIDGIKRVRYMSPHPFYLNERMIAALADCQNIAPHLHLPAQSGNDRILKEMRRNYTRQQFVDRSAALKAALPDLQLTTDLIVGFPSETEAEFNDTLSMVTEVDFGAAYCFKYSPRETTQAAAQAEQIAQEVKEERLERLLTVVNAQTQRHLQEFVGREVELLLETPTDGRTQYHFKARLDAPAVAGSLVKATVTGTANFSLKAKISSRQTSCEAPSCHANV